MTRSKTVLSIALAVIGGCTSLLAQNNDPATERLRIEAAERARQDVEQRDWETKIFPVKYVDPGELRAALSMFRSNINYSGGGLRVLSVRAPKEIMPAIEDAIKRLDVPAPRRDAELMIFVVLASDQTDPVSNVPSTLQPVLKQLQNVLAYKGYQVVDTLITRASEGRSPTILKGTVTLPANQLFNYNFQSNFRVENTDGKTPSLHLYNMNFRFQPAGREDVVIAAEVDVPQGQQVVVGKTTIGDKALILIMTSKFSN